MTQHLSDNIELLFESSWEVCNKIGGIYTVLSTKANVLKHSYGDKLIFIGPDVWSDNSPSPYFIPDSQLLNDAERKLSLPFGVKIRTGRWNVPGKPIAVLVDFQSIYPELNTIYGKMWDAYRVDSLHSYGDYSEGCAFGVASAIVMIGLARHLRVNDSGVVAHFDEWTTAMGLLYIQQTNPCVTTLFTTHATSIGRSICGNGKPLYDYFEGYHGDQMAAELNMESKHSLEKAAAHAADCFTTVSDVTAHECEQLLDIRPQVVTPNGFEPDFVPDTTAYNDLREQGRSKILNIAKALIGQELPADTFIVATSGRNEYRNKGIDVFIDSCVVAGNMANEKDRKILALILVPAWVKEPAQPLLDRINGEEDFNTALNPNFLTHYLNNQNDDNICRRLNEVSGVINNQNVNIIFLPCYLSGNDGVLNISYYDLLPAIDLTVFPSYYEPWGYTPLESIAFGVPTLSTDKAGFGQWIKSNYPNSFESDGAYIISRTDSNYGDVCNVIGETIANLSGASDEFLNKIREVAMRVSGDANWAHFIKYYYEAFDVAIARCSKRVAAANE